MTQDEIIEMAREAGFDIDLPAYENGTALAIKLAKLVAAKALAQRTWVDLTRTQMQDVYFAVLEEHRGGHQMEGQLAFGEALQAKIREKNT